MVDIFADQNFINYVVLKSDLIRERSFKEEEGGMATDEVVMSEMRIRRCNRCGRWEEDDKSLKCRRIVNNIWNIECCWREISSHLEGF